MNHHFRPLRLESQVKEAVWGGRWLAENLGRRGPDHALLGESWEAFSGTVVQNGEFAGRTLGDLFREHGESLFGSAACDCPRFPLLVKFIDARQNLSIQVHPNDRLASELEGYPYGKTEFWYVLEAAPGAEIVFGLAEDEVTREKVANALESGDMSVWRRSPVQAGDVVLIPAGTVHALTAGVVVYELQQDCDITYRLYDWGRTGREIHVEKGLQCVDTGTVPNITRPKMSKKQGYLVGELAECEYFRADLYDIEDSAPIDARVDSFTLLTCINGAGRLDDMPLQRGDTILLPANLAATLVADGESFTVIAAALC